MSLYFSFRHKSLKHLFWYCFSFETWNFWFLSRFGYWCLSLKQNVINYKNANDCRFGVWSKTRTPYNNILLFIVLWPLVLWGQVCAFYIIAAQSLLFSFTFLRAQATFKCLNLHCSIADQQDSRAQSRDDTQTRQATPPQSRGYWDQPWPHWPKVCGSRSTSWWAGLHPQHPGYFTTITTVNYY